MRLLTFALAFLALSCVTAPPVFIHSSTYRGLKFGVNNKSSEKATLLIVVPDEFKTDIDRNKARYMYGALCKILGERPKTAAQGLNASDFKEHRIVAIRRSAYARGDFTASGTTYIVELDYREYGGNSIYVITDGKEPFNQSGSTDCLDLKIVWTGINPQKRIIEGDTYTQVSRGCPGITDARLLISEIVETLRDKQFPNDTYLAFEVALKGGIYGNKFMSCDMVDSLLAPSVN